MSIDDTVRLDTRLAGQVHRYHTWPITGQQTIAEHTWQMLRIYMCVAERYETHLIYHIVFHDIGEHYTGDIPYPVKSNNPKLKEQMDMLEQRSLATQLDYWNLVPMGTLTDRDKQFVKQIEMVEMAEFGMDQMCLGNIHGTIIANRCLEAVYKIQPPPCSGLIQYVIKRLQLFYRQYNPSVIVEHPVEPWWLVDQWRKLNEGKREASGGTPLQD